MKRTKLLICSLALVLFTMIAGCTENPIIEVAKDSQAIVSVVDRIDESISTADILRDFILTQPGMYKKDERLLPSSVEIDIVDSSFSDGDGVEVLLDFGPLGSDAPHGTLCKDGKYRAGKVRLELNMPFEVEGSELRATFNEDEPFYTGDGSEMHTQHGELNFTRSAKNEILMHCTNLISTLLDVEKVMRADLKITTLDEYGDGLVNDVVSIEGDIELKDSSSLWNLSITEPLIKNYELECSKYIIAGVLNVSESDDVSDIDVFFDTDGTETCDDEIAVEVNGRRVIHRY